MALQGNVNVWATVEDTDNPLETTVERPDGSVETISYYPLKQVEGELIENAYVVVRMCAMHLEDYNRFAQIVDPDDPNNIIEEEIETPVGETKAGYRLNIRYHIYTSEDARLNRWEEPYIEIDEEEWIQIDDLSLGGKNIIEYCYDWLKTKQGFENLTNA